MTTAPVVFAAVTATEQVRTASKSRGARRMAGTVSIGRRSGRRDHAVMETAPVVIDEKFRKCATYLFINAPDPKTSAIGKRLVGTAFFVTVFSGNEGAAMYAVTARHIIDNSARLGPLFVRMNTMEGYVDLETQQSEWTCHPSTDVAAIRVRSLPVGADLRSMGLDMLLTDKMVTEHLVGAGDEIFFTGLFSEHPGRQRVQPIMRFGNLSMMPYEPIRVKDLSVASEIDAYLVEARSWGGHSGSPAFVYYPPDRFGHSISVAPTGLPVFLLGLVHGHYDIKSDVSFTGDFLGKGEVPVNAGMAVVVPSQKIIDVLMDDDLVTDRGGLGPG